MAVITSSSAGQLINHSYTISKSSNRQPGWKASSSTTSRKRPLSYESSASADSTSSDTRRVHEPSLAANITSIEGWSPLAAQRLRLFIKSSSTVAKLRIADITGDMDAQGQPIPPVVRLGKLNLPRSSSGVAEQPIKCNIISSYPFERCEIVGTITKKHIAYITRRRAVQIHQAIAAGLYDRPGEGKTTPSELEREVEVERECINLIFYEIDDGSGASITAMVLPAKVHGMSIQQQFDSHFPARRRNSNDSSQSLDPQSITTTPQTSDPRLWKYRYSKPPPPVKTIDKGFKPLRKVPLYEDGTIVRITGSIVTNPKNPAERQIDVKSLTPIVGAEAKHAEHHHFIAVRNLKRDLYGNLAAIAEKLNLTGEIEIEGMQLDTKTSSCNDERIQPNLSFTTELESVAHASRLTNMTGANQSSSYTCMQGAEQTGSKRRKLPSLRSLVGTNKPIDRHIFQLYVHQHLRSECKLNSNLVSGRVTLAQLQGDMKLDWLIEQSAKGEARANVSISLNRPRTTSKAASSMIMPSSSPIKSDSNTRASSKVKISRATIDKSKALLWAWVIRRLYEDGVIIIWPATLINDEMTPKAKRLCCCVCETDTAASVSPLRTPIAKMKRGVSSFIALSPKIANVSPGFTAAMSLTRSPMTSRKDFQRFVAACKCSRALTSPSTSIYTEEQYQLITKDLLVEHIKPIYSRLTTNQNFAIQPARIASVLRRDEMWKYVSNETVAQAIAMM